MKLDVLGWMGLAVLGSLAIACSTTSADQCSIDADCASVLGINASEAVCRAGTCERRTTPVANPEVGNLNQPCKSTQECVDGNGGKPAICRQDKCVPIVNDLIESASSNFNVGDPIFVGVLSPITTAQSAVAVSEYDVLLRNGVELAVADWQGATGDAITVGNERRPITTVYCDTKEDPARTKACFDYMANVLKAPAVITHYDFDARDVLPLALQSKTFVYCAECDASSWVSDTTNGLVRFNLPSVAATTKLRALWIEEEEKRIRADASLGASESINVALVSLADDAYGATLRGALKFNGKDAAANETAGSFKWVTVDSSTPPDWVGLASTLVSFAPDVVIVEKLGVTFHHYLLPELEARWPKGKRRPHYVTGENEASEFRYQRSVGANDALRKRTSGVQSFTASPETDANFDAYAAAFRARFGKEPESPTGFESFYAVAYAVVAATNLATVNPKALTGEDIRAGFERLTADAPTTPVRDLVPGQIPLAILDLNKKERIDLRGISSALDWDPATGDVRTNSGVYCVARDPSGYFSLEPSWTFDWKKNAPEGTPDTSACGY